MSQSRSLQKTVFKQQLLLRDKLAERAITLSGGVKKEREIILNERGKPQTKLIPASTDYGESDNMIELIDSLVLYEDVKRKHNSNFSDLDLQRLVKKLVRGILNKQKNPEFIAQELLELLNLLERDIHNFYPTNNGRTLAKDMIVHFKRAVLIERDFNIKQKISLVKRARYYFTRQLDLWKKPNLFDEIIRINGVSLLLSKIPTDINKIKESKIKRIVGVVQASEYPLIDKMVRFFRELREDGGVKHDQIETEDFTIESDEDKISTVVKEIVAELKQKGKEGEVTIEIAPDKDIEEAILVHCKAGKVRSTSVLAPIIALLVKPNQLEEALGLRHSHDYTDCEAEYKKTREGLRKKYRDDVNKIKVEYKKKLSLIEEEKKVIEEKYNSYNKKASIKELDENKYAEYATQEQLNVKQGEIDTLQDETNKKWSELNEEQERINQKKQELTELESVNEKQQDDTLEQKEILKQKKEEIRRRIKEFSQNKILIEKDQQAIYQEKYNICEAKHRNIELERREMLEAAPHLINVMTLISVKRKQSNLNPVKFEKVLYRYVKIKSKIKAESDLRSAPVLRVVANTIPQLLSFKALKTYGIKHHDKEIGNFLKLAAEKIVKNPESVYSELIKELYKNIEKNGLSKKGQLFVSLREDLKKEDNKKILLRDNLLRDDLSSDEKSREELQEVKDQKVLEEVNNDDSYKNIRNVKPRDITEFLDEYSKFHPRRKHVEYIIRCLNQIKGEDDTAKAQRIVLLYTHYSSIKATDDSNLSLQLETILLNFLDPNFKRFDPNLKDKDLRLENYLRHYSKIDRASHKKDDKIFKLITKMITNNPSLSAEVFTEENARLADKLRDLDKLETSKMRFFTSSVKVNEKVDEFISSIRNKR